ncbi:MAG: hypothetical protein LBG96_13890 [Tannerella sp.]|nr:hypothetical protein [Tannerella sp.]
MKKLLSITGILMVSQCLCAQTLEHGFIINGGTGYFRDVELPLEGPVSEILKNGGHGDIDYKFHVELGYKLRIDNKAKPFFFDMDLSVGIKKYKYNYLALTEYDPENGDDESISSRYSFVRGNLNLFTASLNATFNYKIYKGLYAGAGIAPTLYLKGFYPDFPLTAKLGYDLKFVGVSAGYKYGLLNALKDNSDFSNGKTGEWQVQLYIPF